MAAADLLGLARDFVLGDFPALFAAPPAAPAFVFPPPLAEAEPARFAVFASFAVTAALARGGPLPAAPTFADVLRLQPPLAAPGFADLDFGPHAACPARVLYAAPGPETAVRGRRESARLGCARRGEALGVLVFDPAARAAAAVFGGSASRCDWLADFDYVQGPLAPHFAGAPGAAHWGFLRSYLAVRGALRAALDAWRPAEVLCAGVSMGGALATLAALDLALAPPAGGPRLAHRSVAAPAVFDPAGAAAFDAAVADSARVVNEADLVPGFPLPLMPAVVGGRREVFAYRQTKNPAPFYRNLGNFAANHTNAYLADSVVALA